MTSSPLPDHVSRIQDEWRRARPDLDTSPLGIIGRLHRIALTLTDEITEVYARFDLSEAEFDLLAALRRAEPPHERSAGELAAHTMVTTGGLTKRVDRLVERGLVQRSTAADDARRRVVALTPAGVRLIDAAFTAHVANEHRLIDTLPDADAAALERILIRWSATLAEKPAASADQAASSR